MVKVAGETAKSAAFAPLKLVLFTVKVTAFLREMSKSLLKDDPTVIDPKSMVLEIAGVEL